MSVQNSQWIDVDGNGGLSKSSALYPDALANGSRSRLACISAVQSDISRYVHGLVAVAKSGLPPMQRKGSFAERARVIKSGKKLAIKPEGESLRETLCAAFGIGCLSVAERRQALKGRSLSDLLCISATRAEFSNDTGSMALAVWVSAEVSNQFYHRLIHRLEERLCSAVPLATAECAWVLSAAVAAGRLGDTRALATLARNRLSAMQAASGLFSHGIAGVGRQARYGTFEDQVYSIQALARFSAANRDNDALEAAQRCAMRLCALQGPFGQWWGAYDADNGAILRDDVVCSVNQHALAPMAFFDLLEAGGRDFLGAAFKGTNWLRHQMGTGQAIVDEELGAIWCRLERRNSRVARATAAILNAVGRRVRRLSGLVNAFPAERAVQECHPHELGWLLYCWLSPNVYVSGTRPKQAEASGQCSDAFEMDPAS
jgi:hypothetical protein